MTSVARLGLIWLQRASARVARLGGKSDPIWQHWSLPFKRNEGPSLFTSMTSARAISPLCWLRQARMTLAPLLARVMAVFFPIPVLLPPDVWREGITIVWWMRLLHMIIHSFYMPVCLCILWFKGRPNCLNKVRVKTFVVHPFRCSNKKIKSIRIPMLNKWVEFLTSHNHSFPMKFSSACASVSFDE